MREYLRAFVKQLPFIRGYFTRNGIYIQGLLDQIDALKPENQSARKRTRLDLLGPPQGTTIHLSYQ